jgi:triosephosphate isomerase
MKGFLNCNFGSKSSKRLAGILMIFVGIVVKVGLVIYGASVKMSEDFTIFDKLDASIDSLFLAGSVLLGIGVAELLKKKK